MRKKITAAGLALLMISFFPVNLYAENEHPEDAPEISSQYIYLEDTGNGQVIWSLNSEDRMYPASMTKMMTEILAIEALPDLDETVLITPDMMAGLYEANASMAGYQAGDEPTVRDLLYGTALASGAECVNALAVRTDGSVSAFVDHMNRKASELGMDSTYFVNPTGLHDSGHYSTCRDIETLFSYCYKNDTFREILSARTYVSGPVASNPSGIQMESTVWSLITGDPVDGFAGGKTGFTYPAGRCLASAAEINGMDLVLVTGKAPNDAAAAVNDAMTVYSWISEHMSRQELLSEHEMLAGIKVIDSKTESLSVYSLESFSWDVADSDDIRVETDFSETITAPAASGEYLGKVTVYSFDKVLYEREYYTEEEIGYSRTAHIKRVILETYESHPVLCYTLITAAAVLLLALIVSLTVRSRSKNRRRKRRKH